MMRENDFREDLYYRLDVFPINLPPLRERIEDIPLLADYFLGHHSDLSAGKQKTLAPSVLSDMMTYTWPGNIRELQNIIKRAIIRTPGDVITRVDLPTNREQKPQKEEKTPETGSPAPFREYLSGIVRDAEEKYVRLMLRIHHGNVNQIARLMEVDRKTVYRKMAELRIDPASYRE
jgi:DNA-binding NtrC family response regulator